MLFLVFGEGSVKVVSVISIGSIEVLTLLGVGVRSGMDISTLSPIELIADLIYLSTINSMAASAIESVGSSSTEL